MIDEYGIPFRLIKALQMLVKEISYIFSLVLLQFDQHFDIFNKIIWILQVLQGIVKSQEQITDDIVTLNEKMILIPVVIHDNQGLLFVALVPHGRHAMH